MSQERPATVSDEHSLADPGTILGSLYLSSSDDQLQDTAQLALRWGASLELPQFVWPATLDDDERFLRAVGESLQLARSVRRAIGLHGPFLDLLPGSPDDQIREVTKRRYLRALLAAHDIGASYVVFHSGYNPLIRAPGSLERWAERASDLWKDVLEVTEYSGTLVIENVWEPTPAPLVSLVQQVGRPNFRVCLDTGHLNLFSIEAPATWLSPLAESLELLHLNDNHGEWDEEGELGSGTFDFRAFFSEMKRLSMSRIRATLESFTPDQQRASHEWLTAHGYL